MPEQISIETVREVCRRGRIELRLIASPRSSTLCLRGEYDGYHEYFLILAEYVVYVELDGCVEVGDIILEDYNALVKRYPRWDRNSDFAGAALVIRGVYADTWESATHHELFVIMAKSITCVEGKDWHLVRPDAARG